MGSLLQPCLYYGYIVYWDAFISQIWNCHSVCGCRAFHFPTSLFGLLSQVTAVTQPLRTLESPACSFLSYFSPHTFLSGFNLWSLCTLVIILWILCSLPPPDWPVKGKHSHTDLFHCLAVIHSTRTPVVTSLSIYISNWSFSLFALTLIDLTYLFWPFF